MYVNSIKSKTISHKSKTTQHPSYIAHEIGNYVTTKNTEKGKDKKQKLVVTCYVQNKCKKHLKYME